MLDRDDFEPPQPKIISVGQTISQAYIFAFGGFFRILGVMWLPYAMLIAAFAVIGSMLDAGILTRSSTSGKLPEPKDMIALFAFLFVVAILLFIQVEGVILEALGKRQGTSFLYFSLDKPVWLLAAALITTTALFAAAIIAILFVIGAIGAAIRATGGALETTPDAKIGIGIAAGIGLTVFFCAFLYAAIRQFFLLAPVVVAEKRLGIRRSWKLSDGNFWRMLTVYLAVILPLAAANFAVLLAVPRVLGTAALGQNAATEPVSAHHVWFLLPYFLVFSTLLYGLVYGAQAFAYRSLVPAEKVEDVF